MAYSNAYSGGMAAAGSSDLFTLYLTLFGVLVSVLGLRKGILFLFKKYAPDQDIPVE